MIPARSGPPFRPGEEGQWLKGHRAPQTPAHPSPHLSQIMLLETARRYNHETECITFLKDFTYSKDDFHRAGKAKCRLGGGGTSGASAGSLLAGRRGALSSLSEPLFPYLPSGVRVEPTL